MARLALALLLATAAIAAGDEGIAPSVGAPTGGHAALVGLLDMPILYGYTEMDQVCAANDPRVIGKGWIPARAPGALLVWYHSRGC